MESWVRMTERERRKLLRGWPDVVSWRDLLQNARSYYENSFPNTAVGPVVSGDRCVLDPGY